MRGCLLAKQATHILARDTPVSLILASEVAYPRAQSVSTRVKI